MNQDGISEEERERVIKALMRNLGTVGAMEDCLNDMLQRKSYPFTAKVVVGPVRVTSVYARPKPQYAYDRSLIDRLFRRKGKRRLAGYGASPGIAEFTVALTPTQLNWEGKLPYAKFDALEIIEMTRTSGSLFDDFRIMPMGVLTQ